MKEKYEVGDIIILDNDEEYSIIKKVKEYYLLLSCNAEPLSVLVVTLKNDEVEIIKDNDIIMNVLCA